MVISIQSIPTPLLQDTDGVVRVAGTRIPLDTILLAFNNGATPEEIAYQYPALDLAAVYASITYYLRNRLEIDEYLTQRAEVHQPVKAENEKRFDAGGIRERLLRRKL